MDRKLEYDETNDLFTSVRSIRYSLDDWSIGVFLYGNRIFSIITEKKPQITISQYRRNGMKYNYDVTRRLEEEIKDGITKISKARRYEQPIFGNTVPFPELKVSNEAESELVEHKLAIIRQRLEGKWWKEEIILNNEKLVFPPRQPKYKKLDTFPSISP